MLLAVCAFRRLAGTTAVGIAGHSDPLGVPHISLPKLDETLAFQWAVVQLLVVQQEVVLEVEPWSLSLAQVLQPLVTRS